MNPYLKQKLNQVFQANLPSSLYLNHYDLHLNYGSTADAWKKYLRFQDVAQFIELELASIAESAARSALRNLSKSPSSQDIQAAKELLNNSKLLQQRNNPKQNIIVTYIPKRTKEEKE